MLAWTQLLPEPRHHRSLAKKGFIPTCRTLTHSAWQRGTLPSRGMSKLVVPLGERETALSDVTKVIEDLADSFRWCGSFQWTLDSSPSVLT